MAHNQTESNETDYEEFMEQSKEDFVERTLYEMFGHKKEITDLESAISLVNERFEKGITNILDGAYFIMRKTKLLDFPALIELLDHPVREVREDAFRAIKRISTKGLVGKIFQKRMRTKMEAALKTTKDFKLLSNFKDWSLK